MLRRFSRQSSQDSGGIATVEFMDNNPSEIINRISEKVSDHELVIATGLLNELMVSTFLLRYKDGGRELYFRRALAVGTCILGFYRYFSDFFEAKKGRTPTGLREYASRSLAEELHEASVLATHAFYEYAVYGKKEDKDFFVYSIRGIEKKLDLVLQYIDFEI